MKYVYFSLISIFSVACNPTETVKEGGAFLDQKDKEKVVSKEDVAEIDKKTEVKDQKLLDSGILIKWMEHGSGKEIQDGDYLNIDYRVSLKGGEIVDGNHLLNLESIPFIVGVGMQTKGWDEALKHLRIGDFAEIIIPAEFARGKKGVPGVIPPNSDNILRIRILSTQKPDRVNGDTKVWTFQENEKNKVLFNEKNKISFHCMAFTKSSGSAFINTYADNHPFELKMEDAGIVPGLKHGLIGAKKADRSFILVQPKDAYGKKGYLDIVQPDELVLYNIFVVDVVH